MDFSWGKEFEESSENLTDLAEQLENAEPGSEEERINILVLLNFNGDLKEFNFCCVPASKFETI